MTSSPNSNGALTPASDGNPSLRDLLRRPPVQLQNYQGKYFMCVAAVKRLITREVISDWIRTHSLHRNFETKVQDQDLAESIVNKSRLLFAALVVMELEHLTFALLSNGHSDESLCNIDVGPLKLNTDEQRKLEEFRQSIAVILTKEHLQLSQDTVLPYTERKSIGKSGSFGQIFRAEVADGHLDGYNESMVAVKIIPLRESEDEQTLLREVETLRQREHPSIVPLLASYTLKTKWSQTPEIQLHLIFPFAEMDLKDWMDSPKPPAWLQRLPKPDQRAYLYRFIYTLVSGLAFLHRVKDGTITAHHDLKPQNILVFGEELKIADFGRSHLRPLAKGSETDAKALGTYDYHPPEYWKDDGSHAKVGHGRAFDIWAMGCIITELATLIVYGWEHDKVTEFRKQREQNTEKMRKRLAELHTPDHSFHNNWTVVESWIHELRIEDDSPKLNATLELVSQMLSPVRESRLYAWEAELDLYNIQRPDDNRVARLENDALRIQPPPPRRILNGAQTPLHRSALKGDLGRLRQLYEAGWSLYVQDPEGLTALDVFGQAHSAYLRDALRALGPEPPRNVTNKDQGRRLLEAASRGHLDMVRELLAQGVDAMFVDDGGRSALYKAVEHNRINVAECLLQRRAKELLRQKDITWADTPLHKAASMGHKPIMKKLLKYSPDIEDQQKQGKTALALAVEWGREEVVEVLLDHGAQTFTQNNMRGTPLHRGAQDNRTAILRQLLKALDMRKRLDHQNKNGDTALLLAIFHRHPEYAQTLFDHGASLHVVNVYDSNVLHVAVEKGLYDFLQDKMREFRRDEIELCNKWKDTPLMIARRKGNERMIDLLEQRLAEHDLQRV